MNELIVFLAFFILCNCLAAEPQPMPTAMVLPHSEGVGVPLGLGLLPVVSVEPQASSYSIALEAQISAPQPVMVGMSVTPRYLNQWKGYLDTGYVRYPFSSTSAFVVGEYSIEVGARYHPNAKWWGFALGLGYRNVQISTTRLSSFNVNGLVLATSAILGLSTFYVSPMLEAEFKISLRWHLAFGLGVQIALIGSGVLNFQNSNDGTNSDSSSVLQSNSEIYYSHLAFLLVPQVTLCRFTYHF